MMRPIWRIYAALGAADHIRVYGWSTERALVFSGIKYGRSPMIAIRVHPMKPAMVVYTATKTAGTHSLVVNVLGTAGHARVDVDAFLVIG